VLVKVAVLLVRFGSVTAVGLTTATLTAAEGVIAVATIVTVAVAPFAMAPRTHETVPAV